MSLIFIIQNGLIYIFVSTLNNSVIKKTITYKYYAIHYEVGVAVVIYKIPRDFPTKDEIIENCYNIADVIAGTKHDYSVFSKYSTEGILYDHDDMMKGIPYK